jgi:hypothetical protein
VRHNPFFPIDRRANNRKGVAATALEFIIAAA